jgi:hypothetical protein
MHTRANQLLMTSGILVSSLAYFNFTYIYSLPIFIGAHWFLKTELDKVNLRNK